MDEADGLAQSQLARAQSLLEGGRWEDAVETLRKVMESHGGKLKRLDRASETGHAVYVPVRQFGQMLLCSLPPPRMQALRIYRSRVDVLAERLTKQGIEDRNEEKLRRVVERMFPSSFTDQALFALGELELSRGDFTAARRTWECISPQLVWPLLEKPIAEQLPGGAELLALNARAGESLWIALAGVDLTRHGESIERALAGASPLPWRLSFPDPKVPLADVRARLVLVSILEGSRERATWELELMRRLHPTASGRLGGQTVKYVDYLAQLLKSSETWSGTKPDSAAPATSLAANDWLTFGGTPDRNGSAVPLKNVGGKPAWSVPLGWRFQSHLGAEIEAGFPRAVSRPAEDARRTLSYFPVVAGSLVLVGDQIKTQDAIRQRIRAWDIQTGKPAWKGADDPGVFFHDIPGWDFGREEDRHLGVPRMTLTVHRDAARGDIVLARLGVPTTNSAGRGRIDRSSIIVAINIASQGKLLPGFPLRVESAKFAFEGTPVTDGRRVYVAMREGDVRPQVHVACYDLADGQLVWRRPMCSADSIGHGRVEEISHMLLTLSEDRIYCNTNHGAVVCLAKEDGELRWLTTYPRAVQQTDGSPDAGLHLYRDLTPCLVSDGLVIAAPSDAQGLIAIDASTGQVAWRCGWATDIVHLLGSVAGNLIASGKRLWWFDLRTGKLAREIPSNPLPATGSLGYGRGTIAQRQIWWPVRDEEAEVWVLDALSGRPLRQPLNLSQWGAAGGNLVLGGGCLLIASPDRLYVWRND